LPIKLKTTESPKTITIKDLNTDSMKVIGTGVEFGFQEVGDGKHLGDLRITPTRIIWYEGKNWKTAKGINWDDLIGLIRDQGMKV
jgi:hypothetical protein